MKQMQALVKTAPDHSEIRQVPVPEPDPSQVVIKVHAAAICGTDLHVYHWTSWAQNIGMKLPVIMGHECCGDVVEVGSNASGLKKGDKVAVETHIPCGECYQCLNGEQHICGKLKIFSIHTNGCFAEYAVVPAICARKIPEEIPYDMGAVMEPLGTAMRSVHETHVGGAVVLVLGCGPIGLFAIDAARALGAARIIASDVSPSRLEIAGQMGADITINPTEGDLVEEVLAATNKTGTDVMIDASGNVAAIQQGFACLRKGGRVALIGLPEKPIELELGKDVVFKEAKIIGIHGRIMFNTWTRMENLLATGKLNARPAITHTLPLAQWEQGFDLATKGEACKVILEP